MFNKQIAFSLSVIHFVIFIQEGLQNDHRRHLKVACTIWLTVNAWVHVRAHQHFCKGHVFRVGVTLHFPISSGQ